MNFLQPSRAAPGHASQPFAGEALVDSDYVLPRLQRLPGFDNETFIRAMGLSGEGVCVLWRR